MNSTNPARAHFDQVLGRAGAVRSTSLGQRDDGLAVLAYPDATDAMIHCVTLGAAEMPITTLHPSEFLCSVRPGQEEAARFLLASTVDVARRGGQMTLGSTITNTTPLLAGTDIRGVLLTAGLWFETLDVLRASDGGIALHVITVLPLTGPEVAYLDEHGSGELEEMLEATGVDVLDVTRGVS